MDMFWNLPRDVAINILSRLPIPSIIKCKAVCKAWRYLINSREFCNGHRQRHLVVFPYMRAFPTSKPNLSPWPYKIEELKKYSTCLSIVHMGLVGSVPLVRSSVDGLILVLRREWEEHNQRVLLWVCNPITREYVQIPNPSDRDFELGLPYPPELKLPLVQRLLSFSAIAKDRAPQEYGNYNFGFGVSRSGQYKVVWITQSECRVYTLGTTRQWRSVPVSGSGLRYNKWNTECELVGGNLYWLDPPETPTRTEISCFDLETEVFTYFSASPPRGDLRHDCYRSLCALDDCLCLCDSYIVDIEIWLMRRHGDWIKKLVIDHDDVGRRYDIGFLFPIRVLEDDNWNEMLLGTRIYHNIYYYSSNDNGGTRIRHLCPSSTAYDKYDYPRAAVYTPSFVPLKTLLMDVAEDVLSF